MNSLTELNGYVSNLSFEFTDNRAPDVTFNIAEPVNQSQTVDEGFPFQSSVGIEINEVLGASLSNPTYTIDVSALVGASVSWASLPPGVTLSTPATRVYRLSGISSKAVWDAVKYATITLPTNYNGVWTYTSTIAYYSQSAGNVTKSWTTTVLVNDVVFLTTPTNFAYSADTVSAVTGYPQIINVDAAYPAAVWTVIATPSSTAGIDTWTTTGVGGTFSVNSTTKVITISGTRAQVNARLAGLTLDSTSVDTDFILTYALSNNLNSTTDSAVQNFTSYGLTKLTNPSSMYFVEDATSVDVEGTPEITDTGYDGSGAYTLTITPSATSAVKSLIGAPQAKSITVSGNAKLTTAQKKFGTASITFDGASSSYLTATPLLADQSYFNFGNGDFTVEFWIRIPYQAISGGVMNNTSSGQYGPHLGWSIVVHDGYVEFLYGVTTPSNFSPLVAVYNGGKTSRLIANTWTHISFICKNGVLTTYKNGVSEQQTSINSIAASTSALQIGKGYYFNDGLGNSGGYWRETWTSVVTPAVLTPVRSQSGTITSITIVNGGSGYTTAPTLTISAPNVGSFTATATATVTNGVITSITMTNVGAGYTVTPTVTITGGNTVNGSLIGFVDEIRVSNVARYNSNFALEVAQYTWDKNTRLLIHADGENNSTSITDDVNVLGLLGSYSYNSNTKVLTMSGTRDEINDRLEFFKFIPETDWGQDFAFTYFVNTPRDQTATKQQILFAIDNPEIVNMNINRSYTANRANQIFVTNTPYISDVDASEGLIYTISFSSALGKFAFGTADVPVSFLSFTGTKAQCNAKFADLRFYPTVGVFANGTFTYTQIKNGATQVTQNVSLTGTYAPYNNTRSFLITTSQTYTPSPADVEYGNWELALVGGGGAGNPNEYAAGGGGGGQVLQISNATISNQTYSLTVGSGGINSNGGNTVAFNYTALGGLYGSVFANNQDQTGKTGGDNGGGNVGGQGRQIYNNGTPIAAGGGGGGAAQVGGNATSTGQAKTLHILASNEYFPNYTANYGTAAQRNQTYTNVYASTSSGSGTGIILDITFSNTWNIPPYIDPYFYGAEQGKITIKIVSGGLNYVPGEVITIPGNLIGGAVNTNDMYIKIDLVGYLAGEGGRGTYIAWEANANSMYGYYGGGGAGGASNGGYPSIVRRSGSIGNLITFAANGGNQSSGLTNTSGTGGQSYINSITGLREERQPTAAPAGSGGGGGGRGGAQSFGGSTNGGSGVIGIRITSKG